LTIEEYIKSKDTFYLMPFVTVYTTIVELIKDGYLSADTFKNGGKHRVEDVQPEPERKVCRGLYSSSDFVSNR
jgi:hypothetical protein